MTDKVSDTLRGGVRILAALGVSFLLTLLVIVLAHGSPRVALTALADGAFGSAYALADTLTKTTPLLLTGLGIAIAFRARLWNIGGEGQFLVGALAASALGAYVLDGLPSLLLLPIILVAGALSGALWAGLAGWMRVTRSVPEVISTIMLNFIAAQVLSYLVHGPMQEKTHAQPASEALPPNATLPTLWAGTTLHLGFLVALGMAIVVSIFLSQTGGGFALRVVGANPEAARVAGFDVGRTRLTTMLWSGALCGLAGAVQLSGVVGTLYENYAPGYGFTAVAVALLGRLNPYGIIASALFFGALTAGSGSMERTASISANLSYVLQAVTLLVLLGFQWIRWERQAKLAEVIRTALDRQSKGIPVSRSFVLTQSSVDHILQHALSAIDQVHGTNGLPQIPYSPMKSTALEGVLITRGRRIADLRISTKALHPELTAVHEIGHVIDFAALPISGGYTSEAVTEHTDLEDAPQMKVQEILGLLKRSHATQELVVLSQKTKRLVQNPAGKRYYEVVDQKSVAHLMRVEEVFARAYAQYITLRSGDERLIQQLAQRRRISKFRIYYPSQWEDDEFETIALAFDQLFEELKWIKL